MKLFAVVGMHRSGTSIVSRVLNLLGAHLGPEADMMPAKPDNPTGFWETLSVAQLHDDLFAELGGRWDLPPVLEPGWESKPSLEPYAQRISAIVESHFSGAEIAVWKDPRGSLFLPLWRRMTPIEKSVLCVRRPEDVAGSLAVREGLDPERAAALWLRYTVAAWLDETPHVLVSYDESHDSPLELARRLSVLLGVPSPNEGVQREIRSFVSPALRHYHAMQGDPGPAMQLACAVYTLMTTERDDVVRPLLGVIEKFWRLEAHKDDAGADWRALFSSLGSSVLDLSRGRAG